MDQFGAGHKRAAVLAVVAMTVWMMAGVKAENVDEKSVAMGREALQLLQRAAAETKGKEIRRLVERARELIEAGAGVNVTGEQGRTALHWIAIGSTQSKDNNVQNAYRELAEILIDREADINAEDDYGNTALDWEETDPQDSLMDLFLQAGAGRGRSHDEENRLAKYINELSTLAGRSDWNALRSALQADIPVGTRIQIRLATPIDSRQSRSGDPLKAVVYAPVMDGTRVILGPGTEVHGTILSVNKASSRYRRAELAMVFTNFLHADNSLTRIATQVVAVDNARETVNHGLILGVPFPNDVVGKWSWGLRGLGFVMPGLAEGLTLATYAYGRTLGREIHFPQGTDMQLQVTIPESSQSREPQRGWPLREATPELIELVRAQPARVTTPSGELSDITNLMFIGPATDLEKSFQLAGWLEARNVGVSTALRTLAATMRQNGYQEAPFSRLLLEGKDPDYQFQKSLNTTAKRHHLRVFKRPQQFQGQDVWIASATHDIGIGVGRRGTQWYHLIDPEIDKERQKVADDLLFSRIASSYTLVERPDAPRNAQNATGDDLKTDGRMLVLFLDGAAAAPQE